MAVASMLLISDASAQQVPVTVVHREGQLLGGSPTYIDIFSAGHGYRMTDRGPVRTAWNGNYGSNSGVYIGYPSTQRLLGEGEVISTSPTLLRAKMFELEDLQFTRKGNAFYYKSRNNTSQQLTETGTIHVGSLTNGVRRVAGIGDRLPGGPLSPIYENIYSNFSAGVNDLGVIVYRARLSGVGINPTNNDAVIFDNGVSAGILLQEGNTVAGLPGVTFKYEIDESGESSPQISNGGDVVFITRLQGTGVTSNNQYALLKCRIGQAPQMLLRTGGVAPGFSQLYTISSLQQPVLSASGYLSVLAEVRAGGALFSNTAYAFGPNGWTKHISTGDTASGFSSEWKVDSIRYSRIGDAGNILTHGTVRNNITGEVRWALWLGTLGNPQLVVASGMVAPGLSDTVEWKYNSYNTPDHADFNNVGEVIFHAGATVVGQLIDTQGIWAWDTVRGLRLVVNGSTPEIAVQVSTTNAGSPYVYHPKLCIETQTSSAGTLDNSGRVYFHAKASWDGPSGHSADALFLADLRSPSQALPAFRPTQAAAVESPLVFTTMSKDLQNNNRIGAYRIGSDGTRYTGDLGYRNDVGAKLVGSGDINEDKVLDLVWYNETTGHLSIWVMNNGAPWPSRVEWLPTRSSSSGWEPKLVCDMNKDGMPDIVWQHQTGAVEIWLISRTGPSTITRTVISNVRGGDGLPWKVVGASDMSGDGQPDILFRYEGADAHPYNGAMFLWKLNNLRFDGITWMNTNADLRWKLIGVADADRDGADDIVWWWTGGGIYNGAISYWRMSGTRYLETRSAWSTITPENSTISTISPVLP